MATYNLNDDVNDSFQFEVGGHKYSMVYPTIEELEEIMKAANSPDSPDKDEANQAVYRFISAVDPKSPPISEILKTQNVAVMRNFKLMFRAEFGLE